MNAAAAVQAQLIETLQVIVTAIGALGFDPEPRSINQDAVSEGVTATVFDVSRVSWNISARRPQICHRAVTPTPETQGFILSRRIGIVTH